MRMTMRGIHALLTLVLAACGGREERTLNIHAPLVLERGGVEHEVLMQGRVHEVHFPAGEFDDAWDAVTRRAAPWDALMLTAINTIMEPRGETDLNVALVLAVPLPLTRGTTYDIGRTFAPPSGMPLYWNAWGRRDLQEEAVGELALRVFDYRPVGMEVLNDFIATSVTGTIHVAESTSEQVILRIDLTATDAAGEVVRLQGDVDLRAERYTPPFS